MSQSRKSASQKMAIQLTQQDRIAKIKARQAIRIAINVFQSSLNSVTSDQSEMSVIDDT